jgi:hypothetical protein
VSDPSGFWHQYGYICYNADFLPPVVAMHAPYVIGLQNHAISSARDEESMSFACSNDKESPFVPMHA